MPVLNYARKSEHIRNSVHFGLRKKVVPKLSCDCSLFVPTTIPIYHLSIYLVSLLGRGERGNEHQPRCSKARSKDGNVLKGPWAGPKPHAAASLRPLARAPWLTPRTGGRMAPGASCGRPRARTAMKTSRPVDARL
eukprot:scaffold83366_cov31-Phaeocystis_antarctica.AAC.2